MSFNDKLVSGLVAFSSKINSNKILSSLQEAFVPLNPFIILASIATMFTSLICSPKAGLATVKGFEWLVNYNSLFAPISYGCMNIIALLLAYNMAHGVAKRSGIDAHFGGLLGLVSYVCMSPTTFAAMTQDGASAMATGLSQDVTGSMGMFYALVISTVTVLIYEKLAKIKKFEIKLPASVPPNVSKAFSSLIPTILTVLILEVIRFAYNTFTGSELSALVYTVMQKPLAAIAQTPFGFVGITLLGCMFWVLGIHGTAMTSAFTKPLFLAALTTNINAINAGQAPTEIITKPFNVIFGGMGGFGCTLCLIVAILLFSKREDERAIAKLALPAGIFEINEPVIFGLPIVMNPIYAIPFVLAPCIGQLIGYVATKMGLMPYTFLDVPWVTPPFINAFLACGGKISGALVQLVAFAVIVVMFIPFVKISNRVYEKQQAQNAVNPEGKAE